MPSLAKLAALVGAAATTFASAAPANAKRQATVVQIKAGSEYLVSDPSAPGNGVFLAASSTQDPSSWYKFDLNLFAPHDGTEVPGLLATASSEFAYVQSSTGLVVFDTEALATAQNNDVVVATASDNKLSLYPYDGGAGYTPYICDNYLYLATSAPFSGCKSTTLTITVLGGQ